MPGLILLFLSAYVLIVLIGAAVIIAQIVRPRRKTYAIALAHGLPTEPADLDLVGQEVRFTLPGNHTSPGWIIEGNSPDGPTVLVLHGHRDSVYGALRFAKQLVPHAAHVVLFDWPGHGGCTAKWMTCGMREPGDVIAVLEGLPDEMRQRPVVLFGYSLGAQIAIKTAAEHPRFAGVIADGPYRRWDTPILLRLKHLRIPSIVLIQVIGVALWLANLIRNFDRTQYAAKIDVPLLILHGTEDRVCPHEESQDLADAAPHATFVSIQGGRHNQLFSHAPQAYQNALKGLFDSVRPSADPDPAEASSPSETMV